MGPVFPLEVVCIILGHCGREELLRARLVCNDWNDLCLTHLAKSSHTIKIPYKKIKELVKFLQKTESTPVLPLELTIPSEERNPREVVSMLGTLQDLIVPTCSIVLLDIGKMYRARWIDFYPFLEKISLGLRCLSLPDYFFDFNDLDMREISGMITFPKLRILRLHGFADMKSTFNLKSRFYFNSSLMSSCPALEVLEIDGSLGTHAGDIELMIPVQRLKSLSVNCIRNPHILLNQIREIEGGVELETFRCNPYNDSIHLRHVPVVVELLQELAPNLRHFFYSISSVSDPFISHIPFPMLTRLDVVIEFIFQEFRSRLNFNLCPRMLPALTTLAIPIGRYLVAESELSTVRNLILKAPTQQMATEMTRIDYKDFFSHLFCVCPNVQRVNVEASISLSGPGTWISELLQCSEAVGIEEFGVWNYIRDWIGETPIAAPQPESSRTTRSMAGSQLHPVPILSNVRKIRLSQGKHNCNYTSYYGESPQIVELDFSLEISRHSNSKKRTRLHLSVIRNHFPNLRSLELSPRMLGSDYDSSYAAVREIRSNYPDWEVDLIADDSELFPEVFKGPYDFQ